MYERHVNECLKFSKDHKQHQFKDKSLRQYIAKLHLDGLASSTITSRISALKFHCKKKNIPGELDSILVKTMLKGVRNLEYEKTVMPRKEGCTIDQLERIITLANVIYPGYEATMLSSMFSLAFFGFMRVSEYALTAAGHTIKFNDCKVTKEELRIIIPSSKFNRKRATVVLHSYPASSKICPVKCFRRYRKLRPTTTSSMLYLLADSTPLSSLDASQYLKSLTDAAGFFGITSHSFRIGGATWAASQGWSDASLRAHGRWQSDAFLQYVRPT